MKRKLLTLMLIVAAMLTVIGLAHAEFDPLKVDMTLSTNRFTEPKEITVSISITNTGESEMPGTVTLYYPNGKQVEEFGEPVLDVGVTKSWSGRWKVTEAQLEKGKITFAMEYYLTDDNNELIRKRKSFSKRIILESAQPATVITRTIQPTMAGKDQPVNITYEIANTGTVDITDIRITENRSISSKTGTISEIKAGEKASYTFEVKMGTKDLTSSGAITYKAGGKEYTETKEAETITYGEVKLATKLTSDKKGGVIGDTAVLTLTVTNSGTLAYEGITVVDPVLGEVFTDLSVPAGETLTMTKEVPIETTNSYQFSVSAKDESGVQIDTATERVTVTAINPNEIVDVEVLAAADRDSVYDLPGTVRFTVSVTNNSDAQMKDVRVSAGGYTVYTFPTVDAHETRSFERELQVSMAGTYQFTATVKDQLGTSKTFTSNAIRIREAAAPTPVPTAVPQRAPVRPDVIPTHTPVPAGYDPEGRSASAGTEDGVVRMEEGAMLKALGIGLLVPAAIGLVLTLIGLINRIRQSSASRAALDHLEISETRDYEQMAEEEPEEESEKEEDRDTYQQDLDESFEREVEAAAMRRRRSSGSESEKQ